MSGILGSVRQLFSGAKLGRSKTLKQAKELMSAKSFKDFKAGHQLNHQTDEFVTVISKKTAKKQQKLEKKLAEVDTQNQKHKAYLSQINKRLSKPLFRY